MTEPCDHRGALPQPTTVHTCSEFCPCQTGGKPLPDFLPGGEGPARLLPWWERAANITRWEARQVEAHQRHLEAENEQLRAALQTIRDTYGKVCGEFELCAHPACNSSYGAWAVADDALTAAAMRTTPDDGSLQEGRNDR